MAIIDRIKYDGTRDNNWLVYKYPSEQFVLGSQLIVNQSQEAIFFRGGNDLDSFLGGTHTLKTGNLPLLNHLVNLPFGGNTPFSAEIYFVNLTSRLNMLWGTQQPIRMEDSKYGLLLSIRAHGQYGVKVDDSRLLVRKLVGAVPMGTNTQHTLIADYFKGLINSKLKTLLADFMIKRKISFLEISAYLDELSQMAQDVISDEFSRYGLSVLNFYIEDISPLREEYALLREMKEKMAVGEFYFKDRSYDVAEQMAANSAGGVAAVGVGIGMGANMASAMTGVMNDISHNLSSKNATIKCQNCGYDNPSEQKFCGNCGAQMNQTQFCTQCGEKLSADAKFCSRCGNKLS